MKTLFAIIFVHVVIVGLIIFISTCFDAVTDPVGNGWVVIPTSGGSLETVVTVNCVETVELAEDGKCYVVLKAIPDLGIESEKIETIMPYEQMVQRVKQAQGASNGSDN